MVNLLSLATASLIDEASLQMNHDDEGSIDTVIPWDLTPIPVL
jgi:hypothetical protein